MTDSYQFQTIHTLEARSNILLEVTQQHFKLTDPQVFQMIQGLLQPTVEILANKGIGYERLRSVLVPSRDRHDRALVFNYNKFDTGDYVFTVNSTGSAIRAIVPTGATTGTVTVTTPSGVLSSNSPYTVVQW